MIHWFEGWGGLAEPTDSTNLIINPTTNNNIYYAMNFSSIVGSKAITHNFYYFGPVCYKMKLLELTDFSFGFGFQCGNFDFGGMDANQNFFFMSDSEDWINYPNRLSLFAENGKFVLKSFGTFGIHTLTTIMGFVKDVYYYVEIVVTGLNIKLYINNFYLGEITLTAAPSWKYFGVYHADSVSGTALYLANAVLSDTRLGPVITVRNLPTSNGTNINFTGDYLSVDEDTTDGNTSYVTAATNNAEFTAKITPSRSDTALAYNFRVNHNVQSGTIFGTKTLIKKSGSELEGDPIAPAVSPTVYSWLPHVTQQLLPDGSSLTQTNLAAAEFGVRLEDIRA